MSTQDSIDEELARLLGKDARLSSEQLAKQLKVSSATVRRRMRILIKSGALRILGLIDPKKWGYALPVLIALDVSHDKLEETTQHLAKYPEVRWVSTTTGRYDIIALTRFRTTDYLAEFLKSNVYTLEGVKDTETFICLDVKKDRYIAFE